MGTIVEISRSQIVKAIRKEPIETLEGGSWYTSDKVTTDNPFVKNKNCSVCAVGAVMRNVALSPFQPAKAIAAAAEASTNGGDAGGDYFLAIRRHNWMAALSSFFEEKYWDGFDELRYIESDSKRKKSRAKFLKNIRKETIEFVEKHFPAKIEIDINGAKPAKDVKVVGHISDDENYDY